MGRIRSIKPQFWTDGSNLELSDSCALFFIGLWNFCDDEGKHRLDLNQLVAELGGRWHRGKVQLFLSCLVKSGQLLINSDTTWIQVTGWSHQKIDKPRQPEVKSQDLQWLSTEESTKALDKSRPFAARIGEDRIREDRIGKDILPGTSKIRKSTANKELNSKVWESYRSAFHIRYGVDPKRNASVNSKISQIAARLGEDAIPIVSFFVEHPDSFYVKSTHAIGLCLKDAESLYIQWRKGKPITSIDLRNYERNQGYAQIIKDIDAGKI
jgi:hypothetical protein